MIYKFQTKNKHEAYNLLKAQDTFYLILVFHECKGIQQLFNILIIDVRDNNVIQIYNKR